MDLVLHVLPHLPVPLDVVLEGDGAGHLDTKVTSGKCWVNDLDIQVPGLVVEQGEEEDRVVLVTLNTGQELLRWLPHLSLAGASSGAGAGAVCAAHGSGGADGSMDVGSGCFEYRWCRL